MSDEQRTEHQDVIEVDAATQPAEPVDQPIYIMELCRLGGFNGPALEVYSPIDGQASRYVVRGRVAAPGGRGAIDFMREIAASSIAEAFAALPEALETGATEALQRFEGQLLVARGGLPPDAFLPNGPSVARSR